MRFDIANCFETAIGAAGLGRDAYERALERTGPALNELQRLCDEGGVPHFSLPFARADLPEIKAEAERLKDGASDIIFVGTGGSSLGGQTLAQLAGWGAPAYQIRPDGPRLHFLDNLDAAMLGDLIGALDLAATSCLIISKSGGTAEPLAQAIVLLKAFEQAGLEQLIPARFRFLTEPANKGKNALRALAEKYAVPVLDHVPGLGGRYSVFSNVGLLPARIAGIAPETVRDGAARVLRELKDAKSPGDCEAAIGAALHYALATEKDITSTVLMAYGDRLRTFTRWHAQLWAESLGKSGRGLTPVPALGPVDQHSQLQLFLDGPADKFFTLLGPQTAGDGPEIAADAARVAGAEYLAGKRIGDLASAMASGTGEALAQAGRPVRTLRIDSADAGSLGALMMHFMLETIFTAHLFGVDPYDQPAVEAGKVLARQNLAKL